MLIFGYCDECGWTMWTLIRSWKVKDDKGDDDIKLNYHCCGCTLKEKVISMNELRRLLGQIPK